MRTRAGNPKAKLKKLKPMSQTDVLQLTSASIAAWLEGLRHIYLKVSHLIKFAPDFPKGVIIEKDGDFDVRKIRLVKLFQWLRDKGYCDITPEYLGQAMERLTKTSKERGINGF